MSTPALRMAEDVGLLPPSGIRAIASAAWAVPDAIHLEFGEPDFDTPTHVVDAGARAARDGRTRYAPTPGIPELRDAVCAKLARDNAITEATRDHVIVTPGGVGGLTLAYRALLETGSEVLVPDPGWPNLRTIADIVKAVPVPYRLTADRDYQPDVDALDSLVTDRTRAIVVNSPSNPLGSVWSRASIEAVAEWATSRGLWIISDECYDQLWLDEPSTSISAVAPDAAVVTVFSLSKTYAMTGWRIGYAYADPAVITRMAKVQETTTSSVSTPTQHAAIAALTGDQAGVAAMRSTYRSRRDAAVQRATELGLDVLRPSGAFYLWVRLPVGAGDATTFALNLLERTGVAVAPGPAFGAGGEGHVRVSLAAAQPHLMHGLDCIAEVALSASPSYEPSRQRRRTPPSSQARTTPLHVTSLEEN
ncbi:pyridoxal phosphate-dependent aminotransferase [Mumia sp. Pv 4-285]|uniref:pyridoxal phosphate-dependent aminotransferase n=1 Tax=Mumia qirimensis TaxID=3234852 RepID=UPI00351CCF94